MYQPRHGRTRRKLLLLPAIGALAAGTFLIHPGDTLSGIAAAHGIPLSALEAANPQVSNPNLIYAGAKLKLPGTVTTAVQPSALIKSSTIPAWAACIVSRESGGDARAQNPTSTASGLFQDLTTTWNGYGGYKAAKDAPVSVQIEFNTILSKNGTDLTPWAADGCPGT